MMGRKKRSCIKYLKYRLIPVFMVLAFFCVWINGEAKDSAADESQNGMVEVYVGVMDHAKQFHMLKRASGYVIGRKEENVYIITNYNTVHCSKDEKEAYVISYTDSDITEQIRIVIKGDVTVEASVFTESQLQNYSILQIDEPINGKEQLALGSTDVLETGTTVYALGFSEDAAGNGNMEFSRPDVEIYEGIFLGFGAANGGTYLQHSVEITAGNTGGPLLDADGYVLGLNDQIGSGEGNAYYTLPIEEIKAVLDSFEIDYESREKDLSIDALKTELENSELLVASKEYKNSSKQVLEEAVSETYIFLEEAGSLSEIQKQTELLKNAQQQLILRMKPIRKLMIFLAAVIVGMLMYIVRLLLLQKKYKVFSADYGKLNVNSIQMKASGTYLEQRNKAEDLRLPAAYLKCRRTGERVLIAKKEFYIGSGTECADYVVKENRAVSRRHAVILYYNDQFFIRDNGSANGTFLNGVEVTAVTQMPIKNGDEIIIADERFEFQI